MIIISTKSFWVINLEIIFGHENFLTSLASTVHIHSPCGQVLVLTLTLTSIPHNWWLRIILNLIFYIWLLEWGFSSNFQISKILKQYNFFCWLLPCDSWNSSSWLMMILKTNVCESSFINSPFVGKNIIHSWRNLCS